MVKDSDIQESQIKAGDQLSVTCHGEKEAQTKQIQVDAILRTSSEKNIHPPYPGGTGLCGHRKEFLETIWHKYRG